MTQVFYIAHRNVGVALVRPRHTSAVPACSSRLISQSEEYEIQFLDEKGRSVKTLCFSADELQDANSAADVPNAVIVALRSLPRGVAIHVDEMGLEVRLF